MKHAFITGGSSGIGSAMALELARRGWVVSIAARRRELLDGVVAQASGSGGRVLALTCDVTDAQSVREAVAQAQTAHGPADLAIANAGVSGSSHASALDLGTSEMMMRTNFFGMLYLYDAVVPSMVARQSGRFVGIASLAGHRGLPGSAIYSASKAAMQNFLESARIDLRGSGVHVITVNPGFIETEMTAKNRFPMPFLMKADRAGRIIVDGILEDRAIIEFPLAMSILVRAARLLPVAIYDRVMSGRKKRRG